MADAEQAHEEFENEDDHEDDDDEDFAKPLVPNLKYETPTMDETVSEINHQKLQQRPLIKMQFIKKRLDFGQPYKFSETDATEKFAEIRSNNDPFMHTVSRVIDIGLQGCNPQVASSTQTIWNRKINKAIEIKDQDITDELDDDNPTLVKLVENVYKEMEEALQSNETIDIFQNDFDLFAGEENEATNNETEELSTVIREPQNFFSMQCKGKRVSCIQFQPSTSVNKSRYIAASFIENLSFEERILYNSKSHKNMIVLWDQEDQHSIEPVMVLTSPLEIICFAFNPKDPNIIVGGAINGQIIMWDLKAGLQILANRGKKSKGQKKEASEIPEINYTLMSQLQDPSGLIGASNTETVKKNVSSHKNPVLCLQWFPNNVEIDRKNLFNFSAPNPPNEIHQFASISCDGQVLIWDIRLVDPKDKSKQQVDITTIQWKALYGIQLFRPEGGGQMGGGQIAFRRNQKNTIFTVSSDEGEVAVVDWAVKPTDEDRKPDMVKTIWQNERNYRPCVGLDVSKFFDDIVLALYDFYFCIFKHEVDVPIFESNVISNAQITCGSFSPSRPGIVVIGRTDGWIDIWDLLDQSHKFTIQYQVVAKPLSFLKFNENVTNNIAIGDQEGYVHIIELPTTLTKMVGDETAAMRDFFVREEARVDYFRQRFTIREELFKKDRQEKEQNDQQEELRQNKEEKVVDEDQILEDEYQEFAKTYYREAIQKLPPIDKKKDEEKKR